MRSREVSEVEMRHLTSREVEMRTREVSEVEMRTPN